ncbi:MAG TPA: alkaline phosphatase family protein [Thermoanaerobaculia bacterium]|nr:alkaline phosphatase family protein [Thermoanaerobaculia bacterium]
MSCPRSGRLKQSAFALTVVLGPLTTVLLLAAALACRSGAPPAQAGTASAAAAPLRRVILISLDGAGNRTLHDLYRQGVLHKGGFERFFREGEVADALIPVDLTLTATNHISLITGFPPAATGIVGNEFYPGGSLSAETVSAFETPIGTETLWEAARRQGRRVGVLTWPGADAREARRTASWGLVFSTTAELNPQILTLARSDWRPAPAASVPPGIVSHAEWLSARVTVGGEEEGAALVLDLFAVDSQDDGETRYDGVVVETGRGDGAGRGPKAALPAGGWGRITWASPQGYTASWLKLLAIAPDLSQIRLYLGGIHRTIAYPNELSESLARREIYWPGAPDNGGLVAGWEGRPGIDLATWTEQAERMAAYSGETLRFAAARTDWDLLLCYIPVIDVAGHRLLLLDPRQSGFSPERRDELTQARTRVWQAVDAELGKLLAGLDLTQTRVVVVSDHGMVPVHTAVDPNAPLAGLGAQVSAVPNGGAAFVHVDSGEGQAARERLLADLSSRYAQWRVDGEAPVDKILTREEASRIGLDHPNSGDLVLFARQGFIFRSLPADRASVPAPVYGAHGYPATNPEMQALYMAIGAGIAPGSGGTVHATDVAPRVAAWLGIDPPRRNPS